MSDDKTIAQVFKEYLERSQFVSPVNAGGLWLVELPDDLDDETVESLWDQFESTASMGISVVFVNFPLKAQTVDPPDGSLVLFSYEGTDDPNDIERLEAVIEGYQESLDNQGRKVAVELVPSLPQVMIPKGNA